MRRTWFLLTSLVSNINTNTNNISNNLSGNKMNWSQLSKAWAKEFGGQKQPQVTAALQRTMPLLEDPTAVPFVCRYRTDVIYPLSTPQIHQLCEMVQSYKKLESLRNRILEHLPADDPAGDKNNTAYSDLKWRVETSVSKSELEDLYAPFKPPSKGSLEDRIRQEHPELIAKVDAFWSGDESVNPQKLQPREAAVTLLANKIASHTATTDAVLEYVERYARIQTSQNNAGMKDATPKDKQDADKKYGTYYDFSSSFTYIKDHQVLAIRRGVQNKALKLIYDSDGERVESRIRRSLIDEQILVQSRATSSLWNEAIHDAWTRLLRKRSTTRLWKEKSTQAEEKSIQVFCDNLQKALLSPPLQPPRPVLALDPGFQAGIKCALLDENGQLLSKNALTTVKFLQSREEGVQTLAKLLTTMKDHDEQHGKESGTKKVITVALGNGHGTQEARDLAKKASEVADIPIDIQLVNEAGASVWSVTEGAGHEFPEEQPAAVAAVSIGRRFQNPLPELVKIPPRSLGLGMYQHDLSEKDLDEKLHLASVNAVAEVGVDGNACSSEILEKIPGLTKTLSQRIIKARPLKAREELLSRVSGLGPKTFENCAAFIRVQGGRELLDNTLVHPESYKLARYLLKKLQWDLNDPSSLKTSSMPKSFKERATEWSSILEKAAEKYELPKERVLSVVNQLFVSITNPDPRLGGASEITIVGASTEAESSSSNEHSKIGSVDECSLLPAHLTSMDELRKVCPFRGVIATVRNVVDFGAFVDFGGENDGLIHRSKLGPVQLSSLLVGQQIGVDILSVAQNHRVSMALTGLNANPDPIHCDNRKPKSSTIADSRKQKRTYSTACKKKANKTPAAKQSKPDAKRRRVEKR